MSASRIKALIIGCGNIAGGYDLRGRKHEVWSHVKAYSLTRGVDLVGVIDTSAHVASKFAKIWGAPFSGTELVPALRKLNPDLVSICSPTETHVPIIKTLCRFGIGGILCEKPLSYDLRQAEQAIEICQKKGILLAVNYQRNWDRQLNRLGQAMREGEFGAIELIRVLYSKGLIHNGSHFVSLLEHWFENLRMQQLLAVRSSSRKDLQADFTATCSGATRIIFQNIPESAYILNEVECFCEQGRLELRRDGLDVLWTERHQDALLPQDRALSGSSKRLPVTLHRAMLEVTKNMVATLRGKEKLKSDAARALQTLRFCVGVRSLGRNWRKYD
ncbi:MAG: Gfo/Idh/MocA family oxidoreductase [Verrucomicrobia bacterium]|nr:Gfo/Idh/MocA family oxidoreductase [Verrucomicrobiota bacterium]